MVTGWVRASELHPHPEMIKNGFVKDDVNQGELGGKVCVSNIYNDKTYLIFRRLLDVGCYGWPQ